MSQLLRATIVTMMSIAVLSGCGNTPGERALTGGGIGAGAGAVGGALIGGDPLTGALIGGGVGALTGAVTDKRQINLDR